MSSPTQQTVKFEPFIADSQMVPEFTVKSILLGALFGIIFGASTVYLALKAGLTVSASIPIAVIAISLGKKAFKTTILENNIIQTTGSAGESIAAGVVFTLPGFLFLSIESGGAAFFNYWTIFTLAMLGGILGTMMMIPLRRSLIVQEHDTLPYPEGTACASVLIAGEKGGDFSKTAYQGLGFAFSYAILQKVFHVIAETPAWVTSQTNKYFPSATVNGEITPEYMGVGYIIGPKIAGVLVAGGVLAWLGLIPLLASLVPPATIAEQLVSLGYLKDLAVAGGKGGWDPATQSFANTASAVYFAYIRQIGAGAVAAGGFITLLKSLPTIISSFKGSLASLKNRNSGVSIARTENDLSFLTVIGGSLALVILIAVLPIIPGDSIISKIVLGFLIIVFGFFFVTVSSRIVGIIGSSSNPISGMTIATLMATSLIFIGIGWTGMIYEPMALVVGGMICIAAANAGATSQDLKTGYIVGATPRYQQIALFIGAIVSSAVIGWTVQILDTPTPTMISQGIYHAIGTESYPAPQGTLMATLIKGLLSFNLDWQFVLVGVFISIVMELSNVKSLSFAVGLYLPLSTTLPIFAGGAIKGIADAVRSQKGEGQEDAELGKGSLFATGLVAGGALFGVIVAVVKVYDEKLNWGLLDALNLEHGIVSGLGADGFTLLGVAAFTIMGLTLYKVARKK
ncbi:MAG: oligopeptide transporter, OPT family [Bacteriovoracaceae bacterium]|nr:oligopeptide transporter, OPT family [Bacteroidota bacterium]